MEHDKLKPGEIINQQLNLEYIANLEEVDKGMRCREDTYEAVSSVYGSGKRFIGTEEYERFMEFKHYVVGLSLRNRFKFDRFESDEEKIRIERLMGEADPGVSREIVDSYLFNQEAQEYSINIYLNSEV